MARTPTPKPRHSPPVYRCNICNQYATRGLHVSARRERGLWFCQAHYEMTAEGQTEIAERMRAMMEGGE